MVTDGLVLQHRERVGQGSWREAPARAGVAGCPAEEPERAAGGGRRTGSARDRAGCPARQLSSPGPAVTQAWGRAQPGAGRGAGAPAGSGLVRRVQTPTRERAPKPGRSWFSGFRGQQLPRSQRQKRLRPTLAPLGICTEDLNSTPCLTLWPSGTLPPQQQLWRMPYHHPRPHSTLLAPKFWRCPRSPVCSSFPPCPSNSSKEEQDSQALINEWLICMVTLKILQYRTDCLSAGNAESLEMESSPLCLPSPRPEEVQ